MLLRDGPNGLTSRAVTDETDGAEGVLHRHFTDFDAFLPDLVLDRASQLKAQASALRESAGTGTVASNLTTALTTLFGPVPVAIIPLVTFRDELRARLQQATSGGSIAILTQATTAIAAYLADERRLGRIAADADIDSLTLSLVGGGHLLFSDRDRGPPGGRAGTGPLRPGSAARDASTVTAAMPVTTLRSWRAGGARRLAQPRRRPLQRGWRARRSPWR